MIILGLTAAVSAADAGIHNKILASRTTMIISNEEMEHIMKKVKSLEDSSLLIKLVTPIIENKTKNKEVDFLVLFICKFVRKYVSRKRSMRI